jgi:hypothetical protein
MLMQSRKMAPYKLFSIRGGPQPASIDAYGLLLTLLRIPSYIRKMAPYKLNL